MIYCELICGGLARKKLTSAVNPEDTEGNCMFSAMHLKEILKDVTMPVYKMCAYHFLLCFCLFFSFFFCKFNFFKLYFFVKKRKMKKKTERFLRIPLYSYLFRALNFVTSTAINRISTVLTTRTF